METMRVNLAGMRSNQDNLATSLSNVWDTQREMAVIQAKLEVKVNRLKGKENRLAREVVGLKQEQKQQSEETKGNIGMIEKLKKGQYKLKKAQRKAKGKL